MTTDDAVTETDDAVTAIDDAPAPESPKPAKRTPSRRGKTGGRAATTRSRRSPKRAAPANELSGTLAAALRELVNGVEDEVTAITGLSAQIDEHVEALNELRA